MASPENQPHFEPEEEHIRRFKLLKTLQEKSGIAIGEEFDLRAFRSRLKVSPAADASLPYTLDLQKDLSFEEKIYYLIHASAHASFGHLLKRGTDMLLEYNPETPVFLSRESTVSHSEALQLTEAILTSTVDLNYLRDLAEMKGRPWLAPSLVGITSLNRVLTGDEFEPYREAVLTKVIEEKAVLHKRDTL